MTAIFEKKMKTAPNTLVSPLSVSAIRSDGACRLADKQQRRLPDEDPEDQDEEWPAMEWVVSGWKYGRLAGTSCARRCCAGVPVGGKAGAPARMTTMGNGRLSRNSARKEAAAT
jgi:hypothetical protein